MEARVAEARTAVERRKASAPIARRAPRFASAALSARLSALRLPLFFLEAKTFVPFRAEDSDANASRGRSCFSSTAIAGEGDRA